MASPYPMYPGMPRDGILADRTPPDIKDIKEAVAQAREQAQTDRMPSLVERAQEVGNHLTIARMEFQELWQQLDSLREGTPIAKGSGDAPLPDPPAPISVSENISWLSEQAHTLVEMGRDLNMRLRKLRGEVGQLY